jgi:carbamate kinase
LPEKSDNSGRKVIISIGGNAIIRRGGTGAIDEQFANTESACSAIAGIAATGARIIITHGNGPVVGNIIIRNEAAKDTLPPMPLYICDADSEGGIGFMIQQSLYNRFIEAGVKREVVAVVTQVVVDPADAAFSAPAKPIGPYYDAEGAASMEAANGWVMAEAPGEAGVIGGGPKRFRRVVASPKPLRVVEAGVINSLSASGVVVIAAGGGGVPVIEEAGGRLKGVEAVVDKDSTTALLARSSSAELFINLTEVDMLYVGFGTPSAKPLKELHIEEARRLLESGEFPPGSMGPKVEAAIAFIEGGGTEVILTTPANLEAALAGEAGTRIYR